MSSYALALNARGQVVGYGVDRDGADHALLWENGSIRDLGSGVALGIDARGQVIGTANSRGSIRAWLWENGRRAELGVLGLGERSDSWPSAINSRGQVVGTSSTSNEGYHPFLWQDGKMTDLRVLGGGQQLSWILTPKAVAINAHGHVVGTVEKRRNLRAYLWRDGKQLDLGTLARHQSAALALNDREQVVGWSTTASKGVYSAFLWQAGKMTKLSAPGGESSYAVAINRRGDVVGASQARDPADAQRAVLWRQGRTLDIAPPPEGRSSAALSINDSGVVIGITYSGRCSIGMGNFPQVCDVVEPSQVGLVANLPAVAAWAWENGTQTMLGSVDGPRTIVTALNDEGSIVGARERASDHTWHAVLWRPQGAGVAKTHAAPA